MQNFTKRGSERPQPSWKTSVPFSLCIKKFTFSLNKLTKREKKTLKWFLKTA